MRSSSMSDVVEGLEIHVWVESGESQATPSGTASTICSSKMTMTRWSGMSESARPLMHARIKVDGPRLGDGDRAPRRWRVDAVEVSYRGDEIVTVNARRDRVAPRGGNVAGQRHRLTALRNEQGVDGRGERRLVTFHHVGAVVDESALQQLSSLRAIERAVDGAIARCQHCRSAPLDAQRRREGTQHPSRPHHEVHFPRPRHLDNTSPTTPARQHQPDNIIYRSRRWGPLASYHFNVSVIAPLVGVLAQSRGTARQRTPATGREADDRTRGAPCSLSSGRLPPAKRDSSGERARD